MKQAPKISKNGTELLNTFDEAARDWGWTEDQGNGTRVDKSEIAYDEAKTALYSFVSKLELRNSKIKKQLEDASRIKMGD